MENGTGPVELARQAELDFGTRVRDVRKARGISQEALARTLTAATDRGYHQVTIARLESGDRPTSVLEVYLLAMVLQVAVTDLIAPGHEDRELVRAAIEVDRRKLEVTESAERLEEAERRYAALSGHGELKVEAAATGQIELGRAAPKTRKGK